MRHQVGWPCLVQPLQQKLEKTPRTEEDAGATEDGVVEGGAGADDEGAEAEVEVRR